MRLFAAAGAAMLVMAMNAPARADASWSVPIWTGPYFGVSVGAGSWDARVIDLSDDMFGEDRAGGAGPNLPAFAAVYGAQLGFNRQYGHIFAGVEADFSGTGYDETLVFDDGSDDGGDLFAAAAWDWFGTVRARLGLAVDDAVFYTTFGLAVVRVDYCGAFDTCVSDGENDLAFSKTEIGFAAGFGTEVRLKDNWSLKAEYLYVDAGSEVRQYDDEKPYEEAQFESSAHIFRAGVNFHVHDVQAPLK